MAEVSEGKFLVVAGVSAKIFPIQYFELYGIWYVPTVPSLV